MLSDTMPQASERHKRQGGTACRGGDGGHGDQDRPGGEGLRLYGACLLAPAGYTHAAERDHGPGRPHTGRDHGHAMPSEHRPPAPPHRYAAGAGGGRVVPEGGSGRAGIFPEEDGGRSCGTVEGAAEMVQARRAPSPPAGDGMQERQKILLSEDTGVDQVTLPPARKKRR